MKSIKIAGGKIDSIPEGDFEILTTIEAKNKKETPKQAIKRLTKMYGRAPDILLNAELFNFSTRKPASDVTRKGVKERETQTHGVSFPGNGTMRFTWMNNIKAPDFLGGYPNLLRNGYKETMIPAGTEGVRGRTAIGIGGGYYHFALIPDNCGVSLYDLRVAMLKAGAVNAINLDGGGSSGGVTPTGEVSSSRPVRGFVYGYLKPNRPYIKTVKVRTCLRIRTAQVNGKVVGFYYNNNRVAILETKNGWCRTAKGWISAQYLK